MSRVKQNLTEMRFIPFRILFKTAQLCLKTCKRASSTNTWHLKALTTVLKQLVNEDMLENIELMTH